MRTILLALLLIPSLAYSEVPTKTLLPVVRFTPEHIVLKDKTGNEYEVVTNCLVKVSDITQFKVKSRYIKEGTKIRFSKKQVCSVEEIVKT